jgi:hypothetical protein|tara:strand:- start:461 stop:649 length:189 start_codon:yes stop_codon:yes gene_type:complete
VNIKLFFDYPKRKDGFTGRENRRYWIIIIKTGKKIRITEKIFDELLSSWDDIWDGKKIPEQE